MSQRFFQYLIGLMNVYKSFTDVLGLLMIISQFIEVKEEYQASMELCHSNLCTHGMQLFETDSSNQWCKDG